jgi:hypothetical protein
MPDVDTVAREARKKFLERENLFRDRYEEEDDDNQVRAVAMHPKTAAKLAYEYREWDVYFLGQPEEMNGYRVVKSWKIPIGEVRIVPNGRLQFYRDGQTIFAWPDITPDSRGLSKTRTFRSGSVFFHPDVPQDVRERLREIPVGEHRVMGSPDVLVRKRDAKDGVYSFVAQFPYWGPRGRRVRMVVHVTEDMLRQERFIRSITETFFDRPASTPEPNFARTDLVKTDP